MIPTHRVFQKWEGSGRVYVLFISTYIIDEISIKSTAMQPNILQSCLKAKFSNLLSKSDNGACFGAIFFIADACPQPASHLGSDGSLAGPDRNVPDCSDYPDNDKP